MVVFFRDGMVAQLRSVSSVGSVYKFNGCIFGTELFHGRESSTPMIRRHLIRVAVAAHLVMVLMNF